MSSSERSGNVCEASGVVKLTSSLFVPVILEINIHLPKPTKLSQDL